jgi:hypothetical protein
MPPLDDRQEHTLAALLLDEPSALRPLVAAARGSPQTDPGRGGCRVLNRASAGRPARGSPVGRCRYILFAGAALRSAPAAGV